VALNVIQWGGKSYTAGTAGTAIEIWSCSLSVINTTADPTLIQRNAIGELVYEYHTSADTHIADTEALEFVKVNQFDPVTGHQITDPSHMDVISSANRGTDSHYHSMTTAVRVSIDDGTRNRRGRGGFFLPRYGGLIQADGRLESAVVADLRDASEVFLNGIGAIAGITVGIWSRRDAGVVAAARLRIGDVPDNISRRKNAMRETYSSVPITP
jgi:hypothetical protein